MSLIVFDMGRRVETPIRPQKNNVKAIPASAKVAPVHPYTEPGTNPHTNTSAQRFAIAAEYQKQQQQPEHVAAADDIMTPAVRTLSPDDNIRQAWNILSDTGFHHLPIINKQRQVLAIVSDRDLMQAIVREGNIWQNNILTLAVKPVICVQKKTDIRQTSNILYEYNIGALPVLNEQHELCGIVTRSDILKLLSHYGPMQLWA